jgi:ABC-2 type transport system permease protein
MNIINRFFLKTVLLPASLYRNWGVNTDHLEAILTAKLTMDDRRTNAFAMAKQKRKKDTPPTKATLFTMLVSLIIGLVFLYTFAIGDDYVTKLTFYFSFFIFMLASTLISDFTSVLIDVRDNLIILPKPVNDRTFVTARLLHIVIHVSKVILPMAIPGVIAMAVLTGWGALIFVLLVLLSTLLTIFIINAVYLLILKITTPEKFKNIISYIQIFFAILIYASFQLLPRLFGNLNMEDFSLRHYDWMIAFPSYWFAAAFETLYNFHPNTNEVIGTVISTVFPFLSIYIVIKFLAPAFNRKLSMISGGGETVTSKKVVQQNKRSLSEKLSAIFTRGGVEQAGFMLAWKMSSRSRDFKVKTYPGIGYMVVLLVMMVFNMKKGLQASDFQGQSGIGMITMSVYVISFLLMIAIGNMAISEKFKAAWIYYITPVEKPGQIISGGVKAMVVKFFAPLLIIVLIASLSLAGLSVLPNVLLALSNQLLIAYITLTVNKRTLPFSTQINMDQQSGNFIKAIGRLLLLGAVGVIHFLIHKNDILVYVVAGLSIAGTVMLAKGIRDTEWQRIRAQEEG